MTATPPAPYRKPFRPDRYYPEDGAEAETASREQALAERCAAERAWVPERLPDETDAAYDRRWAHAQAEALFSGRLPPGGGYGLPRGWDAHGPVWRT